jgi:hypothetical protein
MTEKLAANTNTIHLSKAAKLSHIMGPPLVRKVAGYSVRPKAIV